MKVGVHRDRSVEQGLPGPQSKQAIGQARVGGLHICPAPLAISTRLRLAAIPQENILSHTLPAPFTSGLCNGLRAANLLTLRKKATPGPITI